MKVEKHEIMFGNYFSITKDKSEITIEVTDTLKNLVFYKTEEGYVDYCKLSDLKPIPVDDKWLDDFGFDDKDYRDGYIGKAFQSNMILDYPLSKPFNSGQWQDTYVYELGNWRIVKLEYVHKLQNNYLANTSQLLTKKTKSDE